MKLKIIFMVALFFLIAGCEYETSLTDQHKIPVRFRKAVKKG